MNIEERKLSGTFEIKLSPIKDERGFFMRTYDHDFFKSHGLNINWVQENHAKSAKKGTLRGLHFQLPPHAETKLIRCIKGKIQDVWVDLRENSPTFGEWDAAILTEQNKKMILIPKGFAHGYCALTNDAEVVYRVDHHYQPDHESGLLWNDPDVKIDWEIISPVLSEKDKNAPTLQQFKQKYGAIKL